MRIFVDEDTGSSLAKALKAVGVQVEYPTKSLHSIIKLGAKDEDWLPIIGREGRLVLSRNTGILENEAERELVISEHVGIVFLPQHLRKLRTLQLVMRKLDWLEIIDTEPRPFAHRVSATGRTTRLGLS